MGGEDNRSRWAQWVASQIGGDEWRQRTALEAALQALQTGRSTDEAAAAARAAVGAAPQTPMVPVQPGVVRCRFCGSIPAVPMTIYEHNGFVIIMQFKNLKGPFCRNCGLFAWRRMTNTTLLRGWLGLFSFFIAPMTVMVNLVNLPKLNGLPPPQPGSGARAPGDPGEGLLRRPGVYVYLGLILIVVLFLVASTLAAR